MRRLIAAALLLLAGCTTTEIEAVSRTPRSITLHYNSMFTSMQEATDEAERHCNALGRHARQSNLAGKHEYRWVTFDCVE